MASRERRSNPRVAVDISVKLRSKEGLSMTAQRIRNVSLGGVLIEMDDPLPFGTELALEFALPNGPTRSIRCQGFVVWSSKTSPDKAPPGTKGIGVRLLEISIGDMRVLHEFISKQLDPR